MGADLAAVIFGLAASLSWGAGDFSGGLATRKANVVGVVALSQAVGLLLLILLVIAFREPLPSATSLAWGAAAGLAGLAGLLAFYRALAVGQMGIVAPLSAVLTAGVPVMFGILLQGLPGATQAAGFVLALLSVWFLAGPVHLEGRPQGVGLALFAGLAFGLFFTMLQQAGSSTVLWPLISDRIVAVAAILLVAVLGKSRWLPTNRQLPIVLLAGIFDAGGNVFFILASQAGRLDVAAVVSSLYPASTVLLARFILHERLTRTQSLGVVIALVAVALIAL